MFTSTRPLNRSFQPSFVLYQGKYIDAGIVRLGKEEHNRQLAIKEPCSLPPGMPFMNGYKLDLRQGLVASPLRIENEETFRLST